MSNYSGDYMKEIELSLNRCDIFVAIGTSGVVYPAAGFFKTAKNSGAITVEVNLQKTGHDFDIVIEGPATQCFPSFVEAVRTAISV